MPKRRRGIVSLIAMLYLLVFSALALGFYSAVTMAAQLAHNDEMALGAQTAAESGLRFIQYELSLTRIPGNTQRNNLLKEVLKDLIDQQGTSANVGGKGIAIVGDAICFPAGPNDFVPLDGGGAGFRAEIRLSDDGSDSLRIKVQGRYRGVTITRAVEQYFDSVVWSTNVFDYGVVNRGPIVINGGALVGGGAASADGSILSMAQISSPVTITGTSGVAGDVYMTNPDGTVSISGGGVTIAGTNVPSVRATHIHAGVQPPDMPIVDAGPFLPYVKNTYKPNQSVYENVLIPANTNPTFSGDVSIRGVMYVEYPNKVTFNGKTSIRGTVVVANGATPGKDNEISFGAGVEAYGMDTLPADFPEELRALRGSTLLAPGFHVTVSGHSGSIGGIMLADSFELAGSSGGVIEGTFIGLGTGTLKFTGGSSIARTKPTGPIPAGLIFPKTYKPDHKTYLEVRP